MIYQLGLIFVLTGCIGQLVAALLSFSRRNSREDGRAWRNEALENVGFYDTAPEIDEDSRVQLKQEILMDARLQYIESQWENLKFSKFKIASQISIVLGISR